MRDATVFASPRRRASVAPHTRFSHLIPRADDAAVEPTHSSAGRTFVRRLVALATSLGEGGLAVIHEKSLFYYGRPYHVLVDTLMKPHRSAIAELIPERSTVLDVGCGTGELSILLKRTKGCSVVGVDVSARMLDFARRRNAFPDVEFLQRDASSLGSFGGRHFDYAVICQVLHELPRAKAIEAIAEAMRVANLVALLDYHSPLPTNPFGLVPRLLEATIGLDHHPQFERFIAAGGLVGLVEEAGFASSVRKKVAVQGGGNDILVLSSNPQATRS